jgi:hypothetical protein
MLPHLAHGPQPDKPYVMVALFIGEINQKFFVTFEQSEYERLFSLFNTNTLPTTLGNHNFKCAPNTVPWSFSSRYVIGMHAVTAEEAKRLQTGIQPGVQTAPGVPGIPAQAVKVDASGWPKY